MHGPIQLSSIEVTEDVQIRRTNNNLKACNYFNYRVNLVESSRLSVQN